MIALEELKKEFPDIQENKQVHVDPISLMVVVNSNTFDPDDTIFPVISHLAENRHVAKIAVVDMHDNPDFFHDFDGDTDVLNVRYANAGFSMDVFNSARVEQASPSGFNAGWFRMDSPKGYDLGKLFSEIKQNFKISFYNNLDNMLDFGSKGKMVELQDSLVSGDGHRYIPQSKILTNAADIHAFQKKVGTDIVIKSFYGTGGKEVFRMNLDGSGDFDDDEALAKFIAEVNGEVYVQEFVKMDKPYDDRVILMYNPKTRGMEATCAVRRIAAEGDWRSNSSQGGSSNYVDIDERHTELAGILGKELQNKGILLAGVDVMFDEEDLDAEGRPRIKIAEINVRNVGGVVHAGRVAEQDFTKILSDGLVDVIREDFALSKIPSMKTAFATHADCNRVDFFNKYPELRPVAL